MIHFGLWAALWDGGTLCLRLLKFFVRILGGECLEIECLAMFLKNEWVLLQSFPFHEVAAGVICNGNIVSFLILLVEIIIIIRALHPLVGRLGSGRTVTFPCGSL